MAEVFSERLDSSYPFDSFWDENNPTYDEMGYPILDRAVQSTALRAAFRQFFKSGVFPSPSSNLQLSKRSGYTINIATGLGIIDGGFGGVIDVDGMDISLTTSPPRGNIVYSVMLRLDDNDESRSLFIKVFDGSEPVEPVIAGGIHDLRLGYIQLPNGAQSIDEATIVDERGTEVCPYASPFVEIDVADISEEYRARFQTMYEDSYEFLQSAIDGTMAGQLKGEIDSARDDISNLADYLEQSAVLASKIDPETLTIDDNDNLSVKRESLAQWLGMYERDYRLPVGGFESEVVDTAVSKTSLDAVVMRKDATHIAVKIASSMEVIGTLSNGVVVNGTVEVPTAAGITSFGNPAYVASALYDREDGGADLYVVNAYANYTSRIQLTHVTITSDAAMTSESFNMVDVIPSVDYTGYVHPIGSPGLTNGGYISFYALRNGTNVSSDMLRGMGAICIGSDGAVTAKVQSLGAALNPYPSLNEYMVSDGTKVSTRFGNGTVSNYEVTASAEMANGNLDYRVARYSSKLSAPMAFDLSVGFQFLKGIIRTDEPKAIENSASLSDTLTKDYPISLMSEDISTFKPSDLLFYLNDDGALMGNNYSTLTPTDCYVYDSRYNAFKKTSVSTPLDSERVMGLRTRLRLSDKSFIAYTGTTTSGIRKVTIQ